MQQGRWGEGWTNAQILYPGDSSAKPMPERQVEDMHHHCRGHNHKGYTLPVRKSSVKTNPARRTQQHHEVSKIAREQRKWRPSVQAAV